jgi:TrkA family protein/RyR domain-containing protein
MTPQPFCGTGIWAGPGIPRLEPSTVAKAKVKGTPEMKREVRPPKRRGLGRLLRRIWRHHVQPWFDYPLLIVVGLWVLVWAIGSVSFWSYYKNDPNRSVGGVLYSALQLFVLEWSGKTGPGSPGLVLEITRFVAPVVAGGTAVGALFIILYDHILRLGIGGMRNHVVICGLGEKGLLYARALREAGERVVVIEQNEGNELVRECRGKGVHVLSGNATHEDLLRKARIDRAKYLLSVCGDDGANAEIATTARRLVWGRKGEPLRCRVHLMDPRLCALLQPLDRAGDDAAPFALELFNILSDGARVLLHQYPVFGKTGALRIPEPQAHPVIVGSGYLGESILLRAAESWRKRYQKLGRKLPVSLIDLQGYKRKQLFCSRHPSVREYCELYAYSADVNSAKFDPALLECQDPAACEITAIYVCLGDDSLSLQTGLTLSEWTRDRNIPIVVCLKRDAGVATLVREADGAHRGAYKNLEAFGLLDQTCYPDLASKHAQDKLARAIHQFWQEDHRRQEEARDRQGTKGGGPPAPISPSLKDWDELDEQYRESNRYAADHIPVKLRAVGYGVRRSSKPATAEFPFNAQEIEDMARMEHERWMIERFLGGWTYAPGERDEQNRTNPKLLPWTRLPEEIRKEVEIENRQMVLRIPEVLARANLEICDLSEVTDDVD